MTLSKKQVERVRYAGAGSIPDILHDGRGLELHVYPSGRKVWKFYYRTADGRRRKLRLGDLSGPKARPPVLTLDDARKRALKQTDAVGEGRDPVADRDELRASATVAELFKAWISRHAKPIFDESGRLVRGKKSWKKDQSRIDRHIVPRLGALKALAVTREDVARLHTEIGQAAPYEANRVLELVRAVFNKARVWGLLAEGRSNPADGVDVFREHPRARWVKPDELAKLAASIEAEDGHGDRDTITDRIIRALEGAAPDSMTIAAIALAVKHPRAKVSQLLAWLKDADPRIERLRPGVYRHTSEPTPTIEPTPEAPYIRACLWLLLLLGGRKSEVLNLRWEDVDLDRAEATFRDTKSGRDHVVPLSPPAVTILDHLERENDWVFPSARKPGQPLNNIDKAWRRVRLRAGLEDVRLHDLRRSCASWMAQAGAPLLVVKSALGHATARTTERVYAHLSQDPVRRALDNYAQQVEQVAIKAKVTPFVRRRKAGKAS